ncbi:hypothetical protein SAMN05444358_1011737 [Ruegeria halocynthiae]|uniref:Uncharacterized protein n=1 Tax=Ruegeria halocynthiae TaxID=985054 RepID=A0A1H2WBU9_9RHOB|nr:hypothetical protein [Ruegeria halocynthiae]SDW77998.1 hypothetical protein SAMN05444358_1011737 [Ruegeria halocynthiae]
MRIQLVTAIVTATFATTIANADDAPEKSYLFVEVGEKAELTDGQLILLGVGDEVSVFSDRPYRDAGFITRAELFEIWGKGENNFEENPPNVALTGSVGGKSQVVILEISNPKVSDDQVTYDYTYVEGSDAMAFDNPVMVIDSFSWRPPYSCCI